MTIERAYFEVSKLGECLIDSPLNGTRAHFTSDESGILRDRNYSNLADSVTKQGSISVFEEAGPR